MTQKALITGITGQDGSYLTEFLLARGYEVQASSAAPAPSTPVAWITSPRTRTTATRCGSTSTYGDIGSRGNLEAKKMTRKDKLFQKVRNNPRDASFADVRQLLLDAGFGERQPKSGSSHVIFFHTALDQIVVLTKGRGALPEYQVKDALKALIALRGGYE